MHTDGSRQIRVPQCPCNISPPEPRLAIREQRCQLDGLISNSLIKVLNVRKLHIYMNFIRLCPCVERTFSYRSECFPLSLIIKPLVLLFEVLFHREGTLFAFLQRGLLLLPLAIGPAMFLLMLCHIFGI